MRHDGAGPEALHRRGDRRARRRVAAGDRRSRAQQGRDAAGGGVPRRGRRRSRLPAALRAPLRGRPRAAASREVIGLYAIVRRAPQEAVGARAEPLLEIGFEGFCVLAGDAPPALSVDALRAHEAAVRRIAQACAACLPARFSAAAADEEALPRELAPRAAEFLAALQLVEGPEQMTLRVHGPGPAPLIAPAGGPGPRY